MKKSLVLFLMLALASCTPKAPAPVTNLPPAVTVTEVRTWQQASNQLNRFADVIRTATTVAIANKANFPSKASYDATLTGLGKAARVGNLAVDFLNKVPNNWTADTRTQITIYMQQAGAELTVARDQGLLGNSPDLNNLIGNALAIVSLFLGSA